ncbi:MAG: hypothetical protein Q4G10_01945 [Bacteroidia bacterium]|nr:hypothetical protein [Bacteroidia bacterium]
MGIIALKSPLTYPAIAILLILNVFSVSAQRKISADVEVKQVADGKVMTINKRVHCANSGLVVTHFLKPEEYYVLTNANGEMKMYMPKTNEVLMENSSGLSSRDELISIFMSGRADDLGLAAYGYKLQSTVREEGYIKKTFTSTSKQESPTVEIVYENFLPIYCGYLNDGGRTVRKVYFSKYALEGRIMLPTRMTEINYVSTKDSTVARMVYSNIQVDKDDPMFDFQIPADAKVITLKDVR